MKRLWRAAVDTVTSLLDELATVLGPEKKPAPVPVRVRRRDR